MGNPALPSTTRSITARTAWLTAIAMVAFAANSLLARAALATGDMDAATYTSVRVVAGAATLALIVWMRGVGRNSSAGNWLSAAMLATYMVFFSFAYVLLGAATGAIILFATVQLTMISVGIWEGERLSPFSWFGFALAIGGMVYLISPGLTAPSLAGAVLMAISGVAWGAYSLFGRGASDPLQATTANFLYAVPMVLAVSLLFIGDFQTAPLGLVLAIVSGALTSACGYVIWYAALPELGATRAAISQLSVPVIAALLGVVLLSEAVTMRLLLASVATLAGLAIVLTQRPRSSPPG